MEKTLFTNILKELNDELKKNKSKIDKALNEEYSKGMPTSFSKIEKIINEYQKVEKFKFKLLKKIYPNYTKKLFR